MEKLRNKIDVRLISNKKDYIKWTTKPQLYVAHRMFDNKLDAIRKSKVELKLNKPAYLESIFQN